jgi:V-type H+-transporting ATPase subunit a
MFLAKEKALYMNLNMTRPSNNAFIGYFWAPVEQENTVLGIVNAHPNSKVEPFDNHFIPRPTYIKTTPFISVFQQIVDTYGIPTYQEANPAVVSIVTFPFLFGMMFGDVGHGSIIFIFSAILVLFNK